MKTTGSVMKNIYTIGIPATLNLALPSIQVSALNAILAPFPGSYILVLGVYYKLQTFIYLTANGIVQGIRPLVGYNYGAGSYDRVKRTYWKAFRVAMTVGIVFFLCFQFFPTQLVSIFGTGSKEYYEFAARYFRIFMFMTFVNGIQPMSSGFFTSIGKAKLGIVVSLTRQVIFLLPLILIFPIFMGIDGVMYAGPIADAAAGIIAIGFAVKEIRAMDKIA